MNFLGFNHFNRLILPVSSSGCFGLYPCKSLTYFPVSPAFLSLTFTSESCVFEFDIYQWVLHSGVWYLPMIPVFLSLIFTSESCILEFDIYQWVLHFWFWIFTSESCSLTRLEWHVGHQKEQGRLQKREVSDLRVLGQVSAWRKHYTFKQKACPTYSTVDITIYTGTNFLVCFSSFVYQLK